MYESGEIEYDEKNFVALPTSWRVAVSQGCKTNSLGEDCHVTLTIRGTRCPDGGCPVLPRQCGFHKNCIDDQLYGVADKVLMADLVGGAGNAQQVSTPSSMADDGSGEAAGGTTTSPTSTTAKTSTVAGENVGLGAVVSTSSTTSTIGAGAPLPSHEDAQLFFPVEHRIQGSLVLGLLFEGGDVYDESVLFPVLGPGLKEGFAHFLQIPKSRIDIDEVRYYVESTSSSSGRRVEQFAGRRVEESTSSSRSVEALYTVHSQNTTSLNNLSLQFAFAQTERALEFRDAFRSALAGAPNLDTTGLLVLDNRARGETSSFVGRGTRRNDHSSGSVGLGMGFALFMALAMIVAYSLWAIGSIGG